MAEAHVEVPVPAHAHSRQGRDGTLIDPEATDEHRAGIRNRVRNAESRLDLLVIRVVVGRGPFVGSDAETVSNVSDCLEKAAGKNVRFVIANKQEGTALAESLAERLGVEVVVFSNFPELSDSEGFEDLLRANVGALIEAAGK